MSDDEDEEEPMGGEEEEEAEASSGPPKALPKVLRLKICTKPLSDDELEKIEKEQEAEAYAEKLKKEARGDGAPGADPNAPKDPEDPNAEPGAEAAPAEGGAEAVADSEAKPKAKAAVEATGEVRTREQQIMPTSKVGQLKEALNVVLGKAMGMSASEIESLPKMNLMTGRKVWSDLSIVRNVVIEGSMTDIMYGITKVELTSVNLRDPPMTNEAEEAERERLAEMQREKEKEKKQRRRKRG